MEKVEVCNKMAVESGHRVLSLLSQPQDEIAYRNVIAQTDDSVVKFKRVVSLMDNRFAAARARRMKILSLPILPKKLFLETPHCNPRNPSTNNPLQLIPPNFPQYPPSEFHSKSKNAIQNSFDCNPGIDTSLSIKLPSCEVAEQNPQQTLQFPRWSNEFHFHHQQQRFKYHADMYSRGTSSGCTQNVSSNGSFMSSLSIDGRSVSNAGGSSFQLIGLPNPSDQTFKGEDESLKCVSGGKCHCSKKRKLRVKRSIKVPAVSNKIADIPTDEFAWRKYGQKPIKGSPYPRAYYKCSTVRGCEARKHVERCLEEPSMVVVTYEGDHVHPRFTIIQPAPIIKHE